MSPSKLSDHAHDLVVKRRRWLLTALGGAAAFGGAQLAWRNYQTPAKEERDGSGLWKLQFENLDGGRLTMATLRGRPLLMNFWATWCPPCVEELPLLNDFYQQNLSRGWQVLGLAIDQLAPVKQFLVKAPVAFPVVLAGANGVQLGRSLGNLAGSLPFTAVFASTGELVQRKIGRMEVGDLRGLALIK